MVNEILNPTAVVALFGLATTLAVGWAVAKSRAEKLDATVRANDSHVESLRGEIQRLSSAPPPPDRTSISPATRREGLVRTDGIGALESLIGPSGPLSDPTSSMRGEALTLPGGTGE